MNTNSRPLPLPIQPLVSSGEIPRDGKLIGTGKGSLLSPADALLRGGETIKKASRQSERLFSSGVVPRISESGFSLLELVVSVAIITVIMGGVFQFMGQVQKRYQGNQVITESNQDARSAMEVMTQEIGQAGFNSISTLSTTEPVESTYQLPYANGILYDSSGNQSNDHTLYFYGDINGDGNQDYVTYSLYAAPGAASVTINGVSYTLCTLYRSFTTLPVSSPPLPAPTTSQPAYPLVQNVLYNVTNKQGPSGLPIFNFSGTSQILIVPSNVTVVGTVEIALSVAVNPENLETGGVQWYTMSTQIRPVNLAAAVAIDSSQAGVYLPAPLVPNASSIATPTNYYQ